MFAIVGFLARLVGGLSVIVVVMLSVIIHEIAHAYAAYKLGDHTAERMGRLSLNPLVHMDLVGSVLVPFLCMVSGGFFFGWAKPVPVDFRNIPDRKRGTFIVAAAGPFANFVLANIGMAIFVSLNALSGDSFIGHLSMAGGGKDSFASLAGSYLMLFVQVNVALMIFNLLPIPPLDGSKILAASVPRRYWPGAEEIISQPMIDTLIGWLPKTWRYKCDHIIWQWPAELRYLYDIVFVMLFIMIFSGSIMAFIQGFFKAFVRLWT